MASSGHIHGVCTIGCVARLPIKGMVLSVNVTTGPRCFGLCQTRLELALSTPAKSVMTVLGRCHSKCAHKAHRSKGS